MQKFYRFWHRDLLNKLIVLALLLTVTALIADLVFILARRSSAQALLADLFPTATLPLQVIQTQVAATQAYESAMATASVPPTMTTMHFDVTPATPTPTPVMDTQTPTIAIQAPVASPVAQTPTAEQASNLPADLACPASSSAIQGKVLEVIDGITIKVLVDGLVYTVRYIGLALPPDESFALASQIKNGELVYQQDVSLVGEGPDKDSMGRLLRYVIAGDKLINLELLQQGLAVIENSAPESSCSQDFLKAEQAAREAKLGFWQIAPATPGP